MAIYDNFKREMLLRRYATSTIETYLSCLKTVLYTIGEHPTINQIKEYLLTLKSNSYHKQMVGTIHKYYEYILKKPLSLNDIPYPRREYKLPEIFSVEEIKSLFVQIHNLKHKLITSLLYGCGLRVGEIINLKLADIDPSRKIINIKSAKGGKDRQVMLPESILSLFHEYYNEYLPDTYIFNGQFGLQYSDRSVNEFLKYYAKRAKLTKNIHAHLLRHSFACHLLDNGTDMSLIQDLLGHNSQKTTRIYAKLSTRRISQIQSPINRMQL